MTVILILLRQVIYCVALFTTIGHSVDGAPQSFQPESDLRVCVGDPVTFTCTVVDDVPLNEDTVWTASGGVECSSALVHGMSLTDTCSDTTLGSSTVFMVNGAVQGMDCVQFEFTAAMATANMDDTLIECRNGSAGDPSTLVGSSRLFVEGDPPSAPTDVSFTVDDSDPQQAFVVRWSGATVDNGTDIGGYNVDISGSDDGCGVRGVPQFTAGEAYRCPMPLVGVTYNFNVSAVCGTLEGTAAEGGITLRVPEAPTLSVRPVYDHSTELLRIESTSTTVPAVTIANGVNGSADAYIFSYNGGSQSVVSSEQCIDGTCTDEFTPTDPTVSQYTVSVTARNVVGEGPPDTAGPINATNNLLEVEVDVVRRIVLCRFLGGFAGTAQCQIEYSTQADLSGSVVDTGSSTSGDTVTVTLTATLEGRTTYYYRVTATAEGGSVRVQGIFQTACPLSDLVQGLEVQLVTDGCDSGFVGGVITSAGIGRACYNGTATGSIAVYACNCPSLYRLEGTATRICQSDGTWSGAMPQCLPECDNLPDPVEGMNRFVGVNCSQNNSVVTATYSCGLNEDDLVINFSTPIDGNCRWPEPPCEVCSRQELGELPVRESNGNTCGIGTSYYVQLSGGTGRACFNSTTDGSVAVFSCFCGSGLYTLSPVITETTCQNGHWNNNIPSCVANCSAITQRFPIPTNTLATPIENTLMEEEGTCQVMYRCDDPDFPFVVNERDTIMFTPNPVPENCGWENPPNCTDVDLSGSVSSPFPLEALAGIIVGVIIMLIAIGVIIGILIWWQGILGKDTPKWLIVTIVILCFVVVGFGILLYLLIRLWCIEDKTDSPDSPKSGKGKKRRGKKSQDIPMESGGEYGRLQHGGTLTPTYTDTSADPMYSHLAEGKAEEGSAEEYSQLQRQKPAKPVANISDASYSHFEGESGGEYGRLQHGGTLTPTYTDTSADPMYSHLAEGKAEEGSAEEYSQLQRQKPAKAVANISDANYSHFEGDPLPPEVYSEVNQGPLYKMKQTSLTGL